ncbi:MAG: hypothetical protein HQK93_09575 [Nitrospirae bacterium]|nr:hypothetical protein [Nitrospirota bacterium]
MSNKYSVNFSIKRDDLTESIIGGTKLRLLEYVLKDAVNQGITDLITIGDIYSNQCRIVTQLTKKFDMNAHLFINSNGQNYGSSMEENLFISYLAGASITYLSGNDWKFYSLKVERLKKQLIKNKRMPLFIQSGIAGLPGSLGIIKMVREYGLLLDPYYCLIPMLGTINLIEKKIIKSGSNILFIMTGQPYGLFSNRTELLRMVKNT